MITDPKLGPSAATVARGVVENLARVHWISVGTTGSEVKARALHVLRKDVQSSARTTRFTAKRPDRPPMTRNEYAALIKERIDSLDVSGLSWSVSTAIDDIARQQWRHFEPRIPYSNLSSIAHGHLPGLAMLIRGDHKTMRLPRQEVINQVGVALAISDRAVHALQRCPLPLLPKSCVPEQWESITLALMPAIQTLMAEDRGTAPVQTQSGEQTSERPSHDERTDDHRARGQTEDVAARCASSSRGLVRGYQRFDLEVAARSAHAQLRARHLVVDSLWIATRSGSPEVSQPPWSRLSGSQLTLSRRK
ncbi:hypothetical protein [Curtobacterium sp. NPDC089689]|uniref:hypothetical protein n=1 Tax=Curtobacterium sp. NPDC089689 TaxID=3363968 RepID=UPI0038171D19